jgi:hypothetical protein
LSSLTPSETDPVFTASAASGITLTNISNWNTAYGWGDHASAGYLTSFTESDPTVPSHVKSITTTKISNWDTAYGWGDHSSVGYLTSFTETDPTVPSHVKAITTTNISNWNTAYGWGNHASAGYQSASTAITTSNIGSQSVSYAANSGTLTGYAPNQTGGANTIVQRDSNGYIQNSYFYTSGGGSERGTGISYVAGFNSSDYYIRSYTMQGLASAMSNATMNIVGNSSTTNHLNTTRDTPSNSLQYWQAPSLGISEAPSSDWHNTIRMGHGSPLSYYSNTLAIRMTGSGPGDIYTQTIQNGSLQGWKKHWNDSNMDAPNKSGTSYYQVNTWLQFNGNHGLYWPNHYGCHFYPNDFNTYTQFRLSGSKNGYGGIVDSYSAVSGIMYDSAGNGGIYRQPNGRWYLYHHVGNNCTSINTSTGSSSYGMYVEKAIYSTGDIIAYSDRRKKTDIITVENALDKVKQMRGVFYTKVGEEEKGRKVGVIAQEMNEVLPEVVTYAKDIDEYGVAYGNIVGVLIEAIKDQQQQIEELRSLINK